jgi:hypothetical protein
MWLDRHESRAAQHSQVAQTLLCLSPKPLNQVADTFIAAAQQRHDRAAGRIG